jgi:hypothetical protein
MVDLDQIGATCLSYQFPKTIGRLIQTSGTMKAKIVIVKARAIFGGMAQTVAKSIMRPES